MNIEISAAGLDAIARGMKAAPQIVEAELLAAMTLVTTAIEGEVQDAWPTGVFNSRAQIHGDAFSTPAGVLGVVGTPSPYAPVIEFGRKAGKGVSREGQESIALWAKAKLGVQEIEARSVAFLIARAIKRRGQPAKKIFQGVLDANIGQINRAFEDAAARIAGRLEGAGA